MMKVKDFYIEKLDRSGVKDFIEKWHYSKSINGMKSSYCFGLFFDGVMIGAMIYGEMAMFNQWKKYGDKCSDVIELRRLCCIDDTPKNTESRFIGLTLKWLKKNTGIKTVISYADPNHGHTGTIYKASNFKSIGTSSPGRVIVWNGRTYHDKTIRCKYNGKLKPFAQKVKDALESGEAKYIKQLGKIIYEYRLNPTTSELNTKE